MDDKLINSFSLIEYIEKNKQYTYVNGEIAKLSKSDKTFILNDESIVHRCDDNDIILSSTTETIIIPYFLSHSSSMNVSENISQKNSYDVCEFHSNNFDSNNHLYFRLFIPIEKRLDFFTTIEYDTTSQTSFELNKFHFKFYQLTYKKELFLVIESNDNLKYEMFSDYCFSILLSYGFISGNFYQGFKYFISYDNSQLINPIGYSFNSFRDSTFSVLKPICTNPHSYSIKNISSSELIKLSKQQFSNLCEKSISNLKFRMLLLQMIEASKATLITSTFMLAVCLEELVEIFLTDKDTSKTLKNEEQKIFENILKSLENIKCSNKIEKEFLGLITSKVHDIAKNSSNIQKIYKLFEGINLNVKEKEVLINRNKLLHGSLPQIKGVKLDTEKKIDKAYWYLQLRLYTLVSSVILKKVGYTNKVLNHYSFYENAIGFFELNELSYRDL
jgi:hypothetical protein